MFRNINRSFVRSLKGGENDPTINSSDSHCMPLVEIKGFNVLIENKPFLGQPVINKQESYEKLVKVIRSDDYTTGNLIDHSYHQNYYKSLVQFYQNQQVKLFLNKLISQKN